VRTVASLVSISRASTRRRDADGKHCDGCDATRVRLARVCPAANSALYERGLCSYGRFATYKSLSCKQKGTIIGHSRNICHLSRNDW